MSCYHPIKGFRTPNGVVFSELRRHDILGSIELACGQCIGCRMRRASDWTLRCMHEASLWERNCFVTLTYGPGQVPAHGSLDHRDFQLFMKRLRKFVKRSVRFYMCGEYGPVNGRPHYHACLFNVDFEDKVPAGKSGAGATFFDSAILARLWGRGIVSVQDLTSETAGYCARYIMTKVTGEDGKTAYLDCDEDGVLTQCKPDYNAMSLKPGIGSGWFEKYSRDVFPHDFVIADGVKRPVPRYYDRLADRAKLPGLDAVEFSRELKAREHASDNTDERRSTREIVHKARVSTLSRKMENG